jgi:Arc/MetJ-type ribon-helix-helix transcriptional regulator
MYAYTKGMKRVALFLPEQQIAALKQMRNKTGFTVSELIRQAIDLLLDEKTTIYMNPKERAKLQHEANSRMTAALTKIASKKEKK